MSSNTANAEVIVPKLTEEEAKDVVESIAGTLIKVFDKIAADQAKIEADQAKIAADQAEIDRRLTRLEAMLPTLFESDSDYDYYSDYSDYDYSDD